MENVQAEKKEALVAAGEYLEKLIPNMGVLCQELRGNKKEDTADFQNQCINGLNWIIEIYNRTRDLLEAEKIIQDKEAFNDGLIQLGSALSKQEDSKIADVLETGIIPFLERLKTEIQKSGSGS